LGLAALFELQDKRAKSLLHDCDRMLNLLRAHYRNKDTRKVPKNLLEMSRELELPIERVLFCVDVLKDVSWAWAGGWNNPPAPIPERFVSVNESILRYKSVDEIYAELNKQIEANTPARRARANSSAQSRILGLKKSRKVFVVHGHDDGPREATCRLLERLGLVPVVLFEQPNEGQTIIEKFEKHASDADFAIVILSPDDTGYAAAEQAKARPRARQNVVLELGYFTGKLGRQNVVVIHKGEVELPSDYHGVLYVPYDSHGAWKLRLATEIKNSGIEVDLNKVP